MRTSAALLGLALATSGCAPNEIDCTEDQQAYIDAGREWFSGDYEPFDDQLDDYNLDVSAEELSVFIHDPMSLTHSESKRLNIRIRFGFREGLMKITVKFKAAFPNIWMF